MNRIGIIDLGSNSARLVIYEVADNGSYRPCYRMKKYLRLAQYIDAQAQISPAGVHETVQSILAFRNAGLQYEVDEWVAVATAAIRQAENGTDVLDLLTQETTIRFRLLTGDEEAWYAYLGVVNTMNVDDALIIDLGGASTEFIHVRNRQCESVLSIPFGTVTLAKKFDEHDPATQTDAMFRFVQAQLTDFPWLHRLRDLPIIGVGGTARAIAKISRDLRRGTMSRLHGYEVSVEDIERIYNKIKLTNADERKRLADLSESRAEMIHAGLAVFWSAAATTSASRMLVSGSGLREGLFYEHFLRDQLRPVVSSVQDHSVSNFLRLFDVNLDVAARISRCASRLFDQLTPFHQLGASHKHLLEMAALLDLTGMVINVEKYTRHTDYLIRSSHLHGFSQQQLSYISRVVTGKGDPSFRQLNLLMQLARVLVLEAAVDPDEINCQVEKSQLIITHRDGSKVMLPPDVEPLRKGMEKHFGVRIKRLQGSGKE